MNNQDKKSSNPTPMVLCTPEAQAWYACLAGCQGEALNDLSKLTWPMNESSFFNIVNVSLSACIAKNCLNV